MAPEVLQGKGYTYSADLWSVGVVLFEFCCGDLPIGAEIEDPYDVYKILSNFKEVEYPSFFKEKTTKNFIN